MKFPGTNPNATLRSETSKPASAKPWSTASKWGLCGAGVLAAALAIAACIPAGECTGDCAEATAAGGGGGGSSGGSGGGGSSGDPGPPSDLQVADCPHDTIAKVEAQILLKKCGNSPACHNRGTDLYTDLKAMGTAVRLIDKAPQGICPDDKLIDSGDVTKSFFLRKLEDGPKCNDGAEAGLKMPQSGSITDEEKKCLTNYAQALVDWKKS